MLPQDSGKDEASESNANANAMLQPGITFFDPESPTGLPVLCKLGVGRSIRVHSSRLLAAYINMDTSGKVLLLASVVKTLVKVHNLTQEMSVYGWMVLLIHFLLRFEYYPNIQHNFPVRGNSLPLHNKNFPRKTMCGDIDVTYDAGSTLPFECVDRINSASMLDLLTHFLRYLAYDSNLFGCVFTLRGSGEVRD